MEKEKQVTSAVESIKRVIGATSYNITTEATLQHGIEEALRQSGMDFTREVRLASTDRIDFLIGRVGIEVKIKGTKAALIRQLLRYAQHDQIDTLLLVTTVPSLTALPQTLNRKPVHTLILSACLF